MVLIFLLIYYIVLTIFNFFSISKLAYLPMQIYPMLIYISLISSSIYYYSNIIYIIIITGIIILNTYSTV